MKSYPKNIPVCVISDSTTQTIASTTADQAVAFDTNEYLYRIAHSASVSTSEITIPVKGYYAIALSMQVELSTGNNQTLTCWFKINGTNVAHSASSILIPNANSAVQLNHCEIMELDVGDVLEVFIHGTSTNVRIVPTASGSTPTRPAVPSAHISLNLVSELQ